jgi:hypothetical protein
MVNSIKTAYLESCSIEAIRWIRFFGGGSPIEILGLARPLFVKDGGCLSFHPLVP